MPEENGWLSVPKLPKCVEFLQFDDVSDYFSVNSFRKKTVHTSRL